MLEFATEEDLELLRNATPVDCFLDSQIQPYDIIGDDDRTLVSNPYVRPYQNIVLLLIDYGDGEGLQVGTGSLVESDIVLTAGHCLRNTKGYDAVSITVYLAGNKYTSLAKQEITNQSQFHLSKKYTSYKKIANDYGFIKLNDKSMGTAYGWFGIPNTKANTKEVFEIAGFPFQEDTFGIRMVTDSGMLSEVNTDTLVYKMDCNNGQSGSPIFNSARYVVGVHTVGYPGEGNNKGPKVTSEMLALWRSLKS